jgi:membrane dipeptidase
MNRRSLLKGAAIAAAAPLMNFGSFKLFAQSERKYSARAVGLVQRSTVIDMLNPLSLLAVMSSIDGTHRVNFFEDPTTFTTADVERARSSGFNVMHIAVGTGGREAYDETMRFIGLWNGFLAHHGDSFLRIDTPERLDTVKQSGKIGILLGVQNSEHFRKLDDVDFFYSFGQRVSQLTYNARNMIGNGSTERSDGGLSDFGVAVVDRMNKVGMAVDVSHSGDQTTLDACSVSKQPVLFTHANCRALNPHVRCKTDEAIQKMAASGGVMGITGVRMFVSAKEPTTIEDALNHYDHVAKLVGVEHVGVGSDIGLDGYDALPEPVRQRLHAGYKSSYAFRDKDDIEGLDHPKRMFDLTEGLIRRGYSDQNIEAILGGNFRRVLKQIWSARQAPPAPKAS